MRWPVVVGTTYLTASTQPISFASNPRLGLPSHPLYYEQWIRLLDKVQELREFLDQNKGKLKLKD